ncbi:hypothetical protein PCANC_04773 [Puccinia coronata f. sp. avenae]|uniref:Uncharacterized protein n=1 Tax=Puccinia coronata f. sp. avenae TaxID=200324 RepID=A0A2N5VWR0_9BASI|nr:hypothetical protein PCANC_04773 [Puccinia coronata f. sp. avenae]
MSQPTFEHLDPPRRYRSEESKITAILDFMASVYHDPKSFIISLLRIKNDQAATQRRYWRTQRGWNSTLAMLHAVRDFVCTKEVGKFAWEAEMLCEATRITVKQKPPGGCYPNGEYYSSKQVNEAFFDEKTKLVEKSTASKPDSDEPDVFEQLEQEDWERAMSRLNRLRPPPIIRWDAGDLPTQNMDSDGGPSSESSSEEEEDLETSTDEDDSSDDEDSDGSEENSG